MGKLTTVLAKREAETYLAQGLHQEAIKLYDRLLATSPHIDPAIKSAIEAQREKIEADLKQSTVQKNRPLTAAEIGRIRDGWGTGATETDTLVCAQAFVQIGAFSEALEEFCTLVSQGGLKKIYVHAMAHCLAGLYAPDTLAPAAQHLAKRLTTDPKTTLAIQVTMARHMAAQCHTAHARALFGHLAKIPALASAMQTELAALETNSPAAPETDTCRRMQAPKSSPSAPGGLGRLRRFFHFRKKMV